MLWADHKIRFFLRYIDDVELRQAIEKQPNKVKLANRFTRAIAVGNPRGFTATCFIVRYRTESKKIFMYQFSLIFKYGMKEAASANEYVIRRFYGEKICT
ncbi:hypothetical protein ABF87_10785 [Nitrosomonas sp. JL21]|nr:Tn3 family transposase [Nitrosomonas sp.]MCC7090933.1 Tn3 family transposase [Nitrosomonas sp.]MXS78433.1 hypothetical protein [Nitrosomonas sp. JL21]